MNVSTSQFHACAHPCVSLGGNIMPGPISESASVTQHITAAWSQPRRGGKKSMKGLRRRCSYSRCCYTSQQKCCWQKLTSLSLLFKKYSFCFIRKTKISKHDVLRHLLLSGFLSHSLQPIWWLALSPAWIKCQSSAQYWWLGQKKIVFCILRSKHVWCHFMIV